MSTGPLREKVAKPMTIRELYRRRIRAAVCCAVFALAAAVLAIDVTLDPATASGNRFLVWVPAVLFVVAAVMIVRLARESYRFDLGLSGPPEVRILVDDARTWARNGYRTQEEIAAGVAPRSRPPEPRS